MADLKCFPDRFPDRLVRGSRSMGKAYGAKTNDPPKRTIARALGALRPLAIANGRDFEVLCQCLAPSNELCRTPGFSKMIRFWRVLKNGKMRALTAMRTRNPPKGNQKSRKAVLGVAHC